MCRKANRHKTSPIVANAAAIWLLTTNVDATEPVGTPVTKLPDLKQLEMTWKNCRATGSLPSTQVTKQEH